MIRITIRDLHMKTGDWVRRAARSGKVVVMDRRRPVATLAPFDGNDEGTAFAARTLAKGFADLPKIRHDSARYLAEDRGRA